MGLAQNLKRMLKNLERKILVEPFSHYIRRQEELILRKRDSSSSMESSRNHLTQESQRSTIATSSQGTSGRTTMKKTEDLVDSTVKWAKNRIDEMDCVDQIYDKHARIAKHAERRGEFVAFPRLAAILRSVNVVQNAARHHHVRVVGIHGNAGLTGLVALSIPNVESDVGHLSLGSARGKHGQKKKGTTDHPCRVLKCCANSFAK